MQKVTRLFTLQPILRLGAHVAKLLCVATWLFALALGNTVAQDQTPFSQRELDQMLAPIALYPDALLAQITMAATYPLEVVEAERWSVANPRLQGAQAVQAVARNNWDPSVKSLVAFPRILRMMSDQLDWTERLGDAFLGQEGQVMDTVQELRRRAYEAGNLRSGDQALVSSQGNYITIDQADPRIAYEPYYNPTIVYGDWWWPQYPPVTWAPWPGYRERPGFGAGFAWGAGITLGAEFFFGLFDWRSHRVNVVNVTNNYYPRASGSAPRAVTNWQHDPDHRRGTAYRGAEVRQKFSPAGAPPQARSSFRGRPAAAVDQRGARDGGATVPSAPRSESTSSAGPGRRASSQPENGSRPEGRTQPAAPPATRPATPAAEQPNQRDAASANGRSQARGQDRSTRVPPVPTSSPVVVAPPARPNALENIDQASEARNASARGCASRAATPPSPSATPTAAPAPRTEARPVPRPEARPETAPPRQAERAATPAPTRQAAPSAAPPQGNGQRPPGDRARGGGAKDRDGK